MDTIATDSPETLPPAAEAAKPPRRRFKQAAGYLLVGRHVTADKERERMRTYCAEQGIKLAEIYEDSLDEHRHTNFNERPGGRRFLAEMKSRSLRHVIVTHPADAFPEVADMAVQLKWLKRCQRQLHILHWAPVYENGAFSHFQTFNTEDDPAGIFWRTVATIGWVGEANAREQAEHEGRRSAGRVIGSTPYGFDRIGKLLYHNDAEQAVIGRIKRMKTAGATYRDIARTLNEEGIKSKTGSQWFAASVRWVSHRYHRTETFKRDQMEAAR
jgi:hypothetical protein